MVAALLLGLGASACWAVANVAIQRSGRQLGAMRALLWSQVVGLLMVAALIPLVDRRTGGFGAAEAAWALGGGVAALIAYVALFYAFEHGRLTVAVPVMSSWAVLSSGLSLVLFDQRLRPIQLAGAAAVIAGALVVSRFSQAKAAADAPGAPGRPWLLAALAAAAGFGVLLPAIGRVAPSLGSVGAIGVVYVVDIALGLPLAWRYRVPLAAPPRGAWAAVVMAGLFETGGFACIALGGRSAPLAIVSPLASLASAFTVVYAWLVLRERPPSAVLAGAALASLGVVALAF